VALMDRIEARQVSHLVIARKDRLVRFGFRWFERFCAEHGTELMALNDEQLAGAGNGAGPADHCALLLGPAVWVTELPQEAE